MMPDRGPSAKKFKHDLPKPAQNSAKILAQLKNCPFGVNVYQTKSKKLPITEKEFTEIMAIINQKWLEQSGFGENLRIEGMIFNFLSLLNLKILEFVQIAIYITDLQKYKTKDYFKYSKWLKSIFFQSSNLLKSTFT